MEFWKEAIWCLGYFSVCLAAQQPRPPGPWCHTLLKAELLGLAAECKRLQSVPRVLLPMLKTSVLFYTEKTNFSGFFFPNPCSIWNEKHVWNVVFPVDKIFALPVSSQRRLVWKMPCRTTTVFVEDFEINVLVDKLCLETYGYYHHCDRRTHQSHFTVYKCG